MPSKALENSKRFWDDMGRLDPYWAILTRPGTKFDNWNPDEFFATGKEEISLLMKYAAQIGLPRSRSRALDFGCGVGRLTHALGDCFDECVGVDISASMISRARELCRARNCLFVLNDKPELPFPGRHFDLIYTSIVLQHVPEESLIKKYIAEFVRTLCDGGLVAMQVPSHIRMRNRLQARRRLYECLRRLGISGDVLYRNLQLHPIRMTFVPELEVRSVIEDAGGRILDVVPDRKAGSHIVSRTYYLTK